MVKLITMPILPIYGAFSESLILIHPERRKHKKIIIYSFPSFLKVDVVRCGFL